MHQKCLLHYFRDMYRTAEKNVSSEFNLFFMELYGILKDAIATRGYGSEGAVESLKYRIQCIISKEYEDKDSLRYVKRLKRGGKPVHLYYQRCRLS